MSATTLAPAPLHAPATLMTWRRLAWPLALVLLAHLWLLESLPHGVGDERWRPGVKTIEARRIELPPPEPAAVPAPPPAPAAPAASPRPKARPAPAASPSEPAAPAAVQALSVTEAAAPGDPVAPPAAEEPAAAVDAAASAVTEVAEVAPPPPGGGELPVYATRVPPSATLNYEIRRGSLTGSGTLVWRASAAQYELTLDGSVFGMAVIEQVSQGGFDGAGLAPLRFADRRRGRDLRAANFQRDAGKITFSGPTTSFPLVAGAQDRLSWMVQLAAIAAAAPPQALAEGQRVSMFVAGSRGDADVWSFVVQAPGDTPGLLHLLRLPRRDFDTRVEVWLDPARDHWPVRAVQTTHRTQESTELVLVNGPTPLAR